MKNKGNVIVGRLIPAGTGAGMNRLRVTATSRDAALRAANRRVAEAQPAASAPPAPIGPAPVAEPLVDADAEGGAE